MHYLVFPLLAVMLGGSSENSIFRQLTEQGALVDAEERKFVKLPPPSMADGLNAAEQRRVIQSVAGGKYQEFLRKSSAAAIIQQSEEIFVGDEQERIRRLDVWCLVYAELDLFADERFLDALLGATAPQSKSRLPHAQGVLEEEQLRERGIELVSGPNVKERYLYNTFGVFQRVLLSTTRRVLVTSGRESTIAAGVVDSRFDKDAEFPNQWRPIDWNERGDFTLGPPEPYANSASYAKVTRLHEPPGALFLEQHSMIGMPAGWSRVADMLAVKTPLAVRNTVMDLRKKLAAESRRQ